jgi:transcriptional regulator with XRE-family HTH domain
MEIDPALLTIHVRTIRDRRNLSLIAVAQATGLAKSTLAMAEVGAMDFHLEDIARLARVLDANPWELVSFVGYALPCGCCCHRAATTEDSS